MSPSIEMSRASGDYSDRMRERESLEGEQEQRLLANGDEEQEKGDEKTTYKVEWHLRTGWVIFGSILSALLVFCAMVYFTKHFIVVEMEFEFDAASALSKDFRIQSSDYILDPKWNFNARNTVRKYKWTILDRIANPDGVYRQMITINGQFPGPLIECNEGDTLVIEIDNQGSNATAIHFHGIYQNGTNWMDGTSGITQCPIAPQGKYKYEFKVDGQSGTYYYHSHQAAQIADGLFGPLVIHSREEAKLQRIPYATDRIVMVQDYYHDTSSGLLKTSLEPGNEDSPSPNGALINGLNVRDCAASPGRLCDSVTTRTPTFELTKDENHRLRFLNVGSLAWFEISIDGHQFAITEVDGTDVEPVYTTQMHISPAQRYSTIITANSTAGDAFWLRARMMTHCFSDPKLPGPGLDEVKAVIQYAKNSDLNGNSLESEPTSQPWNSEYAVECRDMEHGQFAPVQISAAPTVPDHSYYLRNNLEIGDWRLQRGFFNSSTFRPNLRSPSLHRTLDGLHTANESFVSEDGVNDVAFHLQNEMVIQHAGIKTVDLIIQNFDEMAHPLHLHGNKFWVLGQGHAYFPGYENMKLSLSNPLRRDTAAVEGFGWILLRFVTDNPGLWAFHCHMTWHSEAGLVMQFLNQPEVMANWEIPEDSHLLCNAEGVEKGAAPKDEIWFGFGIGR
jgi:FtsP/CotA-like multicopper oxidase with cupredoxin domain